MKKLISNFFCLAFFLVLFNSNSHQPAQDNIVAFGVVKHNNNKVSGVSVKVFHNEELIYSTVTSRNVGYGFTLGYNTGYTIELLKEGYLKQTILIDTRVSEEVISYGDRLLWEPAFTIHKIMPGLDIEEFSAPVARYMFNEELWGFYKDQTYDEIIKPELDEVVEKIQKLRTIAHQAELARADSLFAAQNYEEAIIAYNEASQYSTDTKSIGKQLKVAKKLLKQQSSADEAYEICIRKADDYFASEEFEMANSFYQKALIYHPKDLYPLDRLYEIDSIRSYSWLEKIAAYESNIKKADSLYAVAAYDSSANIFRLALGLFPDKPYPKDKLNSIDSLKKVLEKEDREKAAREKSISDSIAKAELFASNISTTDKKLLKEQKSMPDSFNKDAIKPDSVSESKQETPKQNLQVVPDHDAEIISIESNKVKLPTASEDSEIDISKLQKRLEASSKEGNAKEKSEILEQMGMIYQQDYNLKKALDSYTQSLEIKKKLGDQKGEVDLLKSIATVMYDSGQYHTAIQQFEESLVLAEDMDDQVQRADILENIATVYESNYRYSEAIDKLEESKKIKEELGDEVGTSQVIRNIGNIYYEQNKFTEAAEQLEKAVSIDLKLENKEQLASSYNNLAAVYYNLQQYDKASDYFEQSLAVSEEVDDRKEMSITLNNIGNINFEKGNYEAAIDFYERSLKIKEDINFKEGLALSLHNIGNSYYKLKNFGKALEFFTSSQSIAEEVKYIEIVWQNFEAFARTYAAMGKYQEAFENYRKYTTRKYESYGQNIQLVELRDQYESSKMAVKSLRRELQKQSRIARYEAERNRRELQIVELEFENNKQKLKRQRTITLVFIIGSGLFLLFSLLITTQYRTIRKAYRLVAEQKRNITEGIDYAARIQKAVLPPQTNVNNLLPEHFILNRPCEVVGGDFYWVTQHFGKTVVVVADCTGHGVPGGFMSMLGISLLNEILSSETPLETHSILTLLRDRVVNALHQQGGDSESLDGMDLTLVMIDPENQSVQFSAAYHSLYIIRNNAFEKVKGDRVPIGFHFKQKPFTSQTIQLKKGNMIYLSSDGYTDQIGGKDQTRYMMGPFKELLLNNWTKPLDEQKAALEQSLDDWKGKLPQTDDVLIMGIRI